MNRRGFIKMLGVTPAIGLLPEKEKLPEKMAREFHQHISKQRLDQILNYKKKEVYFSDKGDDIKGNGSFKKPYKTISRAYRDRPKIAWYILSRGEFQHTINIPAEWDIRVK